VDLYKRLLRPDADDRHTLIASKVFTVFWGVMAVAFASFASLLDNLIQAVNILGSIFYGVILGIFLVAFFVRFVHGTATFVAALVAQSAVILLFFFSDIGYLWFNVIGCMLVVLGAIIAQLLLGPGAPSPQPTHQESTP